MPFFENRDEIVGPALAFVAGFVDVAAFIALTGLFTAHVTGNFVLIGAELVSTSSGVLAKLLALPMFVLAVAVTRLITAALERKGRPLLRPLLTLEAVVLVTFALAGTVLAPLGDPDGVVAISVGMLGVAAMGIQNAVGRIVIGHLAATTVMTVNVTQAVIDLTDRFLGSSYDEQKNARLRRTSVAVCAFAIGTMAGAFAVSAISFACMLVPSLILVTLIVLGKSA